MKTLSDVFDSPPLNEEEIVQLVTELRSQRRPVVKAARSSPTARAKKAPSQAALRRKAIEEANVQLDLKFPAGVSTT